MVKQFLQKNGLQLAIYLVSIAGVMVGLYSAIRNDLLALSFRVDAIEERNAGVDPLVERFLKQEVNVENMGEDITEIKGEVKEIHAKIDLLLQKR